MCTSVHFEYYKSDSAITVTVTTNSRLHVYERQNSGRMISSRELGYAFQNVNCLKYLMELDTYF
jgi:hypothetical protein